MLSVKTSMMLDTAKIPSIAMNVLLISCFEKNIGMNKPVMAIVNVKDDTYNPEIAMEVLKYSDICDIIPIMLNGVLMAIVDSIKMYNNIFGLKFIIKYWTMIQKSLTLIKNDFKLDNMKVRTNLTSY